MAKAKQPSAKMGDTIDGDAVEKPAESAAPQQAAAAASGQAKPDQSPHHERPVSTGHLMALAALMLSVFAVGLAGFAVSQQRQQAAHLAATLPPDSADTIASDMIVIDEKLAALETQLAANRQSQQAALAALAERFEPLASTSSSIQEAGDTANGAVNDLAVIRADMEQRFAALEAALAALPAPAKTAETNHAAASPSLAGQTGLVIVSGLLADNLAGQPLDRWIGLLQGLDDRGVKISGLDQLRTAASPPPARSHHLIQNAYDLVPQMTAALHRAAADAGFLEKTGAKLSQLVQLREIGDGAEGNAAALRQFETALLARNLDGAIRAAGQWAGADLPALDAWLAAAQARQRLDKAVSALVTNHLAIALDVQ